MLNILIDFHIKAKNFVIIHFYKYVFTETTYFIYRMELLRVNRQYFPE